MSDIMHVRDVTERCGDGKYLPLRRQDLGAIWIHRCGLEVGTNAEEVAAFFRNGAGSGYTGSNTPYHYLVSDSIVEQLLPLDERGAHARRFGNYTGIGIGVSGDFRSVRPAADQWLMTLQLCADLLPLLHRTMPIFVANTLPPHLRHGLPVFGHGEIPTAYGRSSGKQQPDGPAACPGRYWPMDAFRNDLMSEMVKRAVDRLAEQGHRLASHRRNNGP